MEEETTNNDILTKLEGDPFNPYEMDIYLTIYSFVVDYLVFIVHIILCISVLAGNGLFFYVIYKFKRLQTRTNYIILNFLICTTCYSICLTLTFSLEAYRSRPSDYYFLACILFLDITFLLALLLTIDWFLSVNNGASFPKYQKSYKWIILSTYLLSITTNLLIFLLSREGIAIAACLGGITYFISLLTMAILNIMKRRNTYSKEALKTFYALSASRIFFLMWLPFVVMTASGIIFSVMGYAPRFSIVTVLTCVSYLLEAVAFSAPIAIVILLGRLDKHFKMSYDYVFKYSVRSYVNPDSNLDEDNLDIDVVD